MVRFLPSGALEITEGARARYNAYVEKYGDRLLPPIQKDFGVERLPAGTYSLTLEAADCWHQMIELRKREQIDK